MAGSLSAELCLMIRGGCVSVRVVDRVLTATCVYSQECAIHTLADVAVGRATGGRRRAIRGQLRSVVRAAGSVVGLCDAFLWLWVQRVGVVCDGVVGVGGV